MHNLGTDGKDFHSTRSPSDFTQYSKYRILHDPADIVIANTIARTTDAAQIIAVKSDRNFEASLKDGSLCSQTCRRMYSVVV